MTKNSRKGFEFWSSRQFFGFLVAYWAIFAVLYFGGLFLSIKSGKNPFLFLFIAFVPYPIIKIYRWLHDPYFGLEESLKQVNPEFYIKLVENSKKVKGIRILTSERIFKRGLLLSELFRWHKKDIDEPILRYIQNVKMIDFSGALSLFILFCTFGVFMLILLVTASLN